LAEVRDGGCAKAVYKESNNALDLLDLLTGLVLDAMEALVSTAARRNFNSMALEVMVLGKPVLSSKPSVGLFYLVVGVSPKD
jgi:hypothetical protein